MGLQALIAGFRASFYAPLASVPVWLIYHCALRGESPSLQALPGMVVAVAYFSFVFGLIVCTTLAPIVLLLLARIHALSTYTGCAAGVLIGGAFVLTFIVVEPLTAQQFHLVAIFAIVGATCGFVATKQFLKHNAASS